MNITNSVMDDNSTPYFKDRSDAGQQLAKRFGKLRLEHALVLALPRGGVPVGFEIARRFLLPLDTLNVRKIGAPHNPEFGIGAVGSNNFILLDQASMRMVGADTDSIKPAITLARQEVKRRNQLYRSGHSTLPREIRHVILVDDGLATGVTARAAIAAVRAKYPSAQITLALPVCPEPIGRVMQKLVDNFVCLNSPKYFNSVGEWYDDFKQVSDSEVLSYLTRLKETAYHLS